MKNIAQGLSLKKYKGNKHKDGGIMVNALGNKTKDVNKAVAEVEGGEYNYRYNPNNPKDNYILSEQLGIADIAKQADRFKGNNRIDYNTRTNLLNKSMKKNEMLRVQQEQSQMQMAAFGGKLKKYKNGSFLLKGSQSIVDSMVANSKANDTTKIATAPEIKLGTAMPLSYSDKLITNPLDLNLNKSKEQSLTKLPTTAPKTTAEAANTGMQVNTQNNATPEPTINKKGVKDVTSGLSGIASAFGPIGQGVGAAIQLAPYAIDLGKAMFDKTSVQDLQTQGSAMRLPNTTYAKNGGKLNVKPLPKFEDGTNINKKPITTDPILQTIINNLPPQESQYGLRDFAGVTPTGVAKVAPDNIEREREYDRRIGIPNALRSFYSNKGLTPNYGNTGTNNLKNSLDVVEPPKQKDKLSEMLKNGLMLKGSAMAGSLFSALQPAQKETLRLPDFGRADDAMSRATAFSMNPALNEVEQARGKSQESIRNMATTAGQYTSNMQSVNQRAGQQAAGLRVQEQQIMNQLAGQKAGYETQKASAIQQELARFDENTLMNKAATQDARVAFVENINNLGTEIMKQGNEQDIADQQDKLAVQNAKLKIIQSAFENPDIISGANLENILKMIEKGDYTNIPKLFGQPSDTRRVLKKEEERLAQQNK